MTKTIPGLVYELKRTDSLRRAEDVAPYQEWDAVGEPVVATGPTVTLEDPNPPADKAFCRVEASAP